MLRVAFTNLYGPAGSGDNGDVLAEPLQFSDCEVEIPYANDVRTAKVTISVHDPAAKEVRPLDRLLKVWYEYDEGATRLVFWGPITVPEWNMKDETLTIAAHDPGLRVKHSYINHSDTAILAPSDVGGTQAQGSVTTDGDGMRALLDSVTEDVDFPPLGIAYGYNTNPQAPLMTSGVRRAMKVIRGDEAFQKMQDLSNDLLAPDFEFEPFDGVSDFPGAQQTVDLTGPWPIADATPSGGGATPSHFEVPIVVTARHTVGYMRMSFYLRHTFVADLNVRLRHPDGTEVTISDNSGGNRKGWGMDCDHRLFVADDAPWDFNSANAQRPYIVGSIAPVEPFAKFRGKPAQGTWRLIVEDQYLGDSGTLYCFALRLEGRGNRIPGQYARMHTWAKTDNDALAPLTGGVWSTPRLRLKGPPDKRNDVVFEYGFGADNLDDLTYSPGGDRVLNYYVAVTESNDDSKPQHRAIRQSFASRVRYGTFMGWQATTRDLSQQTASPADFLNGVAEQYVEAYGSPPDFLTFTPRVDSANVPRYVRDYWPGDTVTVRAKKGALALTADAFITKVTLKQADSAGNTQTVVEAVPLAPLGPATDPGSSL